MGQSSQNQNDLRTGIVGAGPDRTGKYIKDGTAFPATIIQDGGAIAPVGTLPSGQQMPVGTAQTLRMEDILQKMVTFLLIQQIGQGKTDHGTVALYVPDFGRIPQTLCGSHLPWGFIYLPT